MPDVYGDRGLEIAESECSVNGLRLSFERRFYTEKGEEVVNALQGVTQIAYIEIDMISPLSQLTAILR